MSSQIDQLQKQREDLQQSAETESTMKRRISEFRKTLEQNEVLNTFDRYVFESIVEKVIVGGYDENGNKDPSMLTFIYKTGFENSLDGANFKPPRKNSKAAKQCADLCSDTTDEVNAMCSYHSNDTCGKCCDYSDGKSLGFLVSTATGFSLYLSMVSLSISCAFAIVDISSASIMSSLSL